MCNMNVILYISHPIAAPEVVNMSGDGTVPEHDGLNIFIEVSADPMPSVDWLLNDVSINSSDRQIFTIR